MGYFSQFSPVLSIMGTGLSALGDVEQGHAIAAEANYNAQVASNNAKYSAEAGTAQAEAQSLRGAQVEGRVKAAQGANGIDVNSGSAVRVQEGAREANVVDIANVENNALLRAYGYKDQASLERAEAKQAIVSGDEAALGTVVGSASSLPTDFENMFGSTGGGEGGGDVAEGAAAAAGG